MNGLHESITISFMLLGHTKFSPDWCFGLLKQKFRKTKIDCFDDLVKVLDTSQMSMRYSWLETRWESR